MLEQLKKEVYEANMSTRFAPLSYEKPKALLKVKGEILIEREIRQLQEAGITDITVVVGYMRVDTNVVGTFFTKSQTLGERAFYAPIGSESVNDAIRLVAHPGAILNNTISRVFSYLEDKGHMNFAVLGYTDIRAFPLNVRKD